MIGVSKSDPGNVGRDVTPSQPYELFNPLDERVIVETLAHKLFSQPLSPLPPADAFYGAGVYALYYSGSFPAYEVLVGAYDEYNHRPIYVGQAQPSGGLVGSLEGAGLGTELYARLCEHAESIGEASNLNLADFRCRYLVVAHLFIGLAEHILIGKFSPPWNGSGFGNHPPGGGREKQKRSAWDTVHPGRGHSSLRPQNQRSEEYWTLVFKFMAEGLSAREAKVRARNVLGLDAKALKAMLQQPPQEELG